LPLLVPELPELPEVPVLEEPLLRASGVSSRVDRWPCSWLPRREPLIVEEESLLPERPVDEEEPLFIDEEPEPVVEEP